MQWFIIGEKWQNVDKSGDKWDKKWIKLSICACPLQKDKSFQTGF